MKENIYKILYKSPIFLLGSTDSKVTFQKLLFESLWCGGSPPVPVLPHGPSVDRWLPWGLGLAMGLGLVSHTLTAYGSHLGLGGGCVGCPSSTFSASPLPVTLVPDLPRACT